MFIDFVRVYVWFLFLLSLMVFFFFIWCVFGFTFAMNVGIDFSKQNFVCCCSCQFILPFFIHVFFFLQQISSILDLFVWVLKDCNNRIAVGVRCTCMSKVSHWIKIRKMSSYYNILEHIPIGYRPFGLKCLYILY